MTGHKRPEGQESDHQKRGRNKRGSSQQEAKKNKRQKKGQLLTGREAGHLSTGNRTESCPADDHLSVRHLDNRTTAGTRDPRQPMVVPIRQEGPNDGQQGSSSSFQPPNLCNNEQKRMRTDHQKIQTSNHHQMNASPSTTTNNPFFQAFEKSTSIYRYIGLHTQNPPIFLQRSLSYMKSTRLTLRRQINNKRRRAAAAAAAVLSRQEAAATPSTKRPSEGDDRAEDGGAGDEDQKEKKRVERKERNIERISRILLNEVTERVQNVHRDLTIRFLSISCPQSPRGCKTSISVEASIVNVYRGANNCPDQNSTPDKTSRKGARHPATKWTNKRIAGGIWEVPIGHPKENKRHLTLHVSKDLLPVPTQDFSRSSLLIRAFFKDNHEKHDSTGGRQQQQPSTSSRKTKRKPGETAPAQSSSSPVRGSSAGDQQEVPSSPPPPRRSSAPNVLKSELKIFDDKLAVFLESGMYEVHLMPDVRPDPSSPRNRDEQSFLASAAAADDDDDVDDCNDDVMRPGDEEKMAPEGFRLNLRVAWSGSSRPKNSSSRGSSTDNATQRQVINSLLEGRRSEDDQDDSSSSSSLSSGPSSSGPSDDDDVMTDDDDDQHGANRQKKRKKKVVGDRKSRVNDVKSSGASPQSMDQMGRKRSRSFPVHIQYRFHHPSLPPSTGHSTPAAAANQNSQLNSDFQTTIPRSNYCCPWCHLNCVSLRPLTFHLKNCHDRLNFKVSHDQRGSKIEARIDVSPNESYDGSYSGNPHDLAHASSLDHPFCGRGAGPHRRVPVTLILVNKKPWWRSVRLRSQQGSSSGTWGHHHHYGDALIADHPLWPHQSSSTDHQAVMRVLMAGAPLPLMNDPGEEVYGGGHPSSSSSTLPPPHGAGGGDHHHHHQHHHDHWLSSSISSSSLHHHHHHHDYEPLKFGHDRLYYHTNTNLPIRAQDLDMDSEGENSPPWITYKTQKMIDEFTDVNEGEKEIMKSWNCHIMKYGYIGDCQMYEACLQFLKDYGREILMRKRLRYNFILHLISLYDFGLIDSQQKSKIIRKLNELQVQLQLGETTERQSIVN